MGIPTQRLHYLLSNEAYGDIGQQWTEGNQIQNVYLSTAQAELLVGGSDAELFIGWLGADTIYANGGNDYLYGGDDNDTLVAGEGADKLYGGDDMDVLHGGTGSDTLEGGSENDSVDGGYDVDVLYGDAGADTLLGGEGEDALLGGSENDRMNGGDDNDILTGGAGEDTMVFEGEWGEDEVSEGEHIEIDGAVLAGVATDDDRDGVYTLNGYDITESGGLTITQGDDENTITLLDWVEDDTNYGITLKAPSDDGEGGGGGGGGGGDDPTPGDPVPGSESSTIENAWYKVVNWYSVRTVGISGEYSAEVNSSVPFGNLFDPEDLDWGNYPHWIGHGDMLPYSSHTDAPTLGEHAVWDAYTVLTGSLDEENPNLFHANGGSVIEAHHLVADVISGPDINANTPPVDVLKPEELTEFSTDAINLPDGEYDFAYYGYYWLYGAIDLGEGVTEEGIDGTLYADWDGGRLDGGRGDDVFYSHLGADELLGGAGFDTMHFNQSWGADTISGGELLMINSAAFAGEASYNATENAYFMGSMKLTMTMQGLQIENTSGSTILIQDWQKSTTNYGITLEGLALGEEMNGTESGELIIPEVI